MEQMYKKIDILKDLYNQKIKKVFIGFCASTTLDVGSKLT